MPNPLPVVQGIGGAIRSLGPGLIAQAAFYPWRKAYATARFDAAGGRRKLPATLAALRRAIGRGTKRPAPPEAGRFAFLGSVQRYHVAGQTLFVECEDGALTLTILAPDLMRVRLGASGNLPAPFSYAVSRGDEDWPPCHFDVTEEGNHLVISTGRLVCRIQRSPCRLGFYDPDGRSSARIAEERPAAATGSGAGAACLPASTCMAWAKKPSGWIIAAGAMRCGTSIRPATARVATPST